MMDRLRGSFFGVIVGDALGTTLEFQPKPAQRPTGSALHTEIVGGGPFGLEPGDWTDDGALTLCLARALAEDEPPSMNVRRQLDYYLRWYDEGFCSSNGQCFDIGGQTERALSHFRRSGGLEAPLEPDGQGNGSLMRAVPVPLWLAHLPAGAFSPDLYREASRTTHNSPVCDTAAVLYSHTIHGVLQPAPEDVWTIADALLAELHGDCPQLEPVRQAMHGDLAWHDIVPSGWVVHSLSIAFWALKTFDSFEEGMVEVVNLCGDADTNGAIYGGLAGAVFGIEAIPQRWLNTLKHRDELEDALQRLVALHPGTDRTPAIS